jgi:predicted TIM-barrel fold metal-dependent hydrolase
MQSPWGEIEVSDAHVHFFSHGFFAALAKQKSAGQQPAETAAGIAGVLGWEPAPQDPKELGSRWTAELDRCGVRRAALIASVPGDEQSVAAAVLTYPQRFYGYFMVNPVAPDAAANVRAALAAGGLHCVCLFPAMHGYAMPDERVKPVLDAAAAVPGTAVFVHCGVLTVGVRRKLGLPSPFDMRYSNPIDLHGVALRYPKIKFIVPHFGAGYFREALMLCDLCPNVYMDTSSSNAWMRYSPEALDLTAVFRRALDVIGARRLLFGSDSSFFPRGWHAAIFEAQSTALERIGVSAADARSIFADNLSLLFIK